METGLDRRFWTVIGIAFFVELAALVCVASIGILQRTGAFPAFAILPLSAIWAIRLPWRNAWLKVTILVALSLVLPFLLAQVITALQYA